MAALTPGFVLPESWAAHGGTRWRRSAVLAVPSAVAVGVLGAAMVRGTVPVGFAVSDQNFTLSASVVRTEDPLTLSATPGSPTRIQNASVEMDGACLNLKPTIPGTGLSLSIVVSMPGQGTRARNLDVGDGAVSVQTARLTASATQPIALGGDSMTQAPWAGKGAVNLASGAAASYGGVRIDSGRSTLSGTVTPSHGLHLSLVTNTHGAPTC